VWTGENVGTFTKDKLKQYAADIVPDTGTFNQCLDSDKTMPVIQADMAEATRMGVQGTPTFFINNRLLNITSLDYSSFARTFDSLNK
jgi:protein-disulfide isomerase